MGSLSSRSCGRRRILARSTSEQNFASALERRDARDARRHHRLRQRRGRRPSSRNAGRRRRRVRQGPGTTGRRPGLQLGSSCRGRIAAETGAVGHRRSAAGAGADVGHLGGRSIHGDTGHVCGPVIDDAENAFVDLRLLECGVAFGDQRRGREQPLHCAGGSVWPMRSVPIWAEKPTGVGVSQTLQHGRRDRCFVARRPADVGPRRRGPRRVAEARV